MTSSIHRSHSSRHAAGLFAAALALLLAACAAPLPAPILLTLPPVLGASATTPPMAASAPTLVVRRVAIPEYMVARRVRYRADASTLAEWPNTYWAERIEIGVSREFVAALRQQLPGWSICETNCADLPSGLALQLDLVPMDLMRASQKLQARARVTLTDMGAPPRVPSVQELAYELPVPADSAQGQAQAITELIRQVAQAAAPLVTAARR
jgi:uncharacterized lipoprotein YmbA